MSRPGRFHCWLARTSVGTLGRRGGGVGQAVEVDVEGEVLVPVAVVTGAETEHGLLAAVPAGLLELDRDLALEVRRQVRRQPHDEIAVIDPTIVDPIRPHRQANRLPHE